MSTYPVSYSWRDKYPAVQYVAPFVLFLAFLSLSSQVHADAAWAVPLWVLLLAVVCFVCWPAEISPRPVHWIGSIAVGVAVFAVWIAPDVLIPGYRQTVFFSNDFIGHLHSSMTSAELQSPWVLAWRTARAVLIVPIVEELFWRAWLMRWLVNNDFRRVPLGAYTPVAFWLTALLFASEHGPYWDVGLLAGLIYNFWMVKTKSVADCILMHAVTNGVLSGFVIVTGQWQYWQ